MDFPQFEKPCLFRLLLRGPHGRRFLFDRRLSDRLSDDRFGSELIRLRCRNPTSEDTHIRHRFDRIHFLFQVQVFLRHLNWLLRASHRSFLRNWNTTGPAANVLNPGDCRRPAPDFKTGSLRIRLNENFFNKGVHLKSLKIF